MKYIVTTFNKQNHLILFPEIIQHSVMAYDFKNQYAGSEVISAGKLYIEPAECYRGQHYVSVNPGSVSLDFVYRTPEAIQQNWDLAFNLLPTELEFKVREHNVFSASTIPEFIAGRTGTPVKLKLDYMPRDAYCPRAKVTLKGLNDEFEKFMFWQTLKHI